MGSFLKTLGRGIGRGSGLFGAAVLVCSCALFDFEPPPPPITEAQLQERQSRQWETPIANVHKSAVFVLRGLGFQITSNTAEKAFIEARGLTRQRQAPDDCRSVWDPYARRHVQNCQPGERYQVFRRFTLTMERIGKYTHLRLIAIDVNSRRGDNIVTDGALYERIFSRIEERLFVRKTLE